MYYALRQGKLIGSNEATACVAVFQNGNIDEANKFLGANISQAIFHLKKSSFCCQDEQTSLIYIRAKINGKDAEVERMTFVAIGCKVSCFVDDVQGFGTLLETIKDASVDTLIPQIISAIISDDYLLLENEEKAMALLETKFLGQKGLHSGGEVIAARKRIMALKRSYEQLSAAISAAKESAKGNQKDAYETLAEDVDSLSEDVLNLREFVSSVRECFQEQVDISLNTVMKFLTVVTSIFMPLSFIAGWYGMNLKMPEVELEYGYFIAIGLAIAVVITCVVYFVKKKWFS